MRRYLRFSLFPLCLAVLTAADEPWKNKQIAEWSEDDAKQVLTDSPWSKTVTPSIERSANNGQRSGGGYGRGGGIGIGGIGIGLPGMGRRGGYGGGGGQPRSDDGSDPSRQPPTLTVRWESALPVREAELKTRDTAAPTIEDDSYAIAVYGVPRRMADADSHQLADQLKKQASIKRNGKKDIKPSSVEVLQRDDGPVIVYLFPRSKEITADDRRLEFDAQINRLQFTQSFYVEDMTYQGKLQL